jgi:hypothetical protein
MLLSRKYGSRLGQGICGRESIVMPYTHFGDARDWPAIQAKDDIARRRLLRRERSKSCFSCSTVPWPIQKQGTSMTKPSRHSKRVKRGRRLPSLDMRWCRRRRRLSIFCIREKRRPPLGGSRGTNEGRRIIYLSAPTGLFLSTTRDALFVTPFFEQTDRRPIISHRCMCAAKDDGVSGSARRTQTGPMGCGLDTSQNLGAK